jgi:hypothetical protein
LRLAAVIGFALLVLAGVAGAANIQTFVDPTGDNQPGSPDITTVQLSNDDNQHFELRVNLANRPDLLDGDYVNVYLDRDANTSTGCGEGVGVDYSLGVLGHTDPAPDYFLLMRCEGTVLDPRSAQGTFSGSYEPATQTVIFRFSCSDVSRPSSFRFVIVSQTGQATATFDFAGNDTAWTYVVNPACPPDVRAPHVRALPGRGLPGKKAKLRYRVSDDSGETQEVITVYRGKRRLGRNTTNWGPADPKVVYFVKFPVPKHAPHLLRFCVRSKDRAGNRSKQACARLTIR